MGIFGVKGSEDKVVLEGGYDCVVLSLIDSVSLLDSAIRMARRLADTEFASRESASMMRQQKSGRE